MATDHERCADCGFDGGRYDDAELCDAVRALGSRWEALLSGAGDAVRARPAPKVWSALEYAAHSRDITLLHIFGVEQAVAATEPAFDGMDGGNLIDEQTATYDGVDPNVVIAELAAAATKLGDIAQAAGPMNWNRGITVGDTRLDVRQLLEHALHDSVHHLDDVERGLASLRA